MEVLTVEGRIPDPHTWPQWRRRTWPGGRKLLCCSHSQEFGQNKHASDWLDKSELTIKSQVRKLTMTTTHNSQADEKKEEKDLQS